MDELLDFTNKTVVVTGAATGMGNAATVKLVERGAEVHAIDIAEVADDVAATYRCDLSDPASIADAVKVLPDRVDALLNCAGIPNGTHWTPLQIMAVNFLGLRCVSEALVERMPETSAITNIASIAGNGWSTHASELTELMATTDFDAGRAWCESQADELLGDGYFFSKEAVQYYTMWRGSQTIKDGVRMNSICPGVTDTKIMADFRAGMGDQAIDMTADVGLGRLATPEEMAPAMLFLSHPLAASYINGVNLIIDAGFTAAMSTNQVDFAKYLS